MWITSKCNPLTANVKIFNFYVLHKFQSQPLEGVLNNYLIANEEIIRINQDSLADYADLHCKNEAEDLMVYRRKLENGDTAFAIFNASEEEKEQILDLEEFTAVRELWTKTDLIPAKEFKYTVEPHCAVVLRASKQN